MDSGQNRLYTTFFNVFNILKSAIFGGVMLKIEFEQNWRYGYVLYYIKQVK